MDAAAALQSALSPCCLSGAAPRGTAPCRTQIRAGAAQGCASPAERPAPILQGALHQWQSRGKERSAQPRSLAASRAPSSPTPLACPHCRLTNSAAPLGRSASAGRARRKHRILRCSSHPSSPSTLSRRDSSWRPPGSPFPPPTTRPQGTRSPRSRCCSPRATFSLPSK